LPALQEGNRKSPRTVAHICKSILDFPGVSEMFWYYMLKNLKMAAKNEGVTEVFKN